MSLFRNRVTLCAILALILLLAMFGVGALFSFDKAAQWAAFVPAALCVIVAVVGVVELRALRATQQSFATAVNNISHGLCMFDSAGRLVLSNQRYIDMYKLSSDVVKPGCSLRDLLIHRQSAGMFVGDVEGYIADRGVENEVKKKSVVTLELPDGRIITTVSQPLPHGGWVATHEDVTELRHREQELARTRTFLNTVIDNVPAAISVKNADDLRYVLVNRAGRGNLWPAARQDRSARPCTELFPDRSMETIEIRDRSALQAGVVQSFPTTSTRLRPKAGGSTRRAAWPVLDESGKPLYLLLVIQDLTEQREAERRAQHLALHDTLTDLPNRAAFNDHLAEADHAATPRPRPNLAVMLSMNFDHFKDINDVYGSIDGRQSAEDCCRSA